MKEWWCCWQTWWWRQWEQWWSCCWQTWWWPAPKERRPSLYSCSGCWYASLLSWNKMPWWKAVMDNGKILQQRKYTRLLHHQCLWQSKRIANHLFFNKGTPAGPVRHDRTPPWLQLVAGHLVQVVFKVVFKCGNLSQVQSPKTSYEKGFASFPYSLDRPNRLGDIVILFNWEGSHLTDLLKEVFTAGLFLDPVLLLASLLDLLQVDPVPHRHRHLLGSHLRGLVSEAQIQTFLWSIRNKLWLWISSGSPQYCPTSSAGGGCAELKL